MNKWVVSELKPDMVLSLRLRSAHERDLVRNNPSLSLGEHLHKIAEINHKYSLLIEEEMNREVIIHAASREQVRFIQAGIFSNKKIFGYQL